MVDLVTIGLRAVEFAAALQAAGVPLFLWLFGGSLEVSAGRIGMLGVSTAATGLVFSIGHALVEPARLAGALSGVFDPSLQGLLLATDAGTTMAIRVLGLAMVATGSLKQSRFGTLVALMGATLIATSFAFMGHTAADEGRWLLAMLLILHLLLVAFWFGALWPLLIAVKLESLAVAGRIIEEFSKLAVWLVPIIFLAGLGLAVALVPNLASLSKPYGLMLLTKVTGFALLMAFAALNKWRLGPKIARGEVSALTAFRGSVLIEWILIVAVVAVTATMTGLFSPAGH